jgi:hypothetical protein
LRPLALSDVPAIQHHFNNWNIIRHLALIVPWPYPDDGAETFIKRELAKIEAGEEITVDYRLSAISDHRWDCACGCASCPGYFDHSFFALSEETQRQYLPYAPKYVRAAYRAQRRARSSDH